MNSKYSSLLILLISINCVAEAQVIEEKLLALFEETCSDCHYEDEEPNLHSEIDLAALRANLKYVTPGDPESSELFYRVTLPDQTKGRMPKSRGNPGERRYREPWNSEQIGLLREWIQGDAPEIAVPEASSLDSKVRAILETHCAECHRGDEVPELHNGINLDVLLRDTEYVRAGDAAASALFQRLVLPADSRQRMPKSRGGVNDPGYRAPVTKEEIGVMREWIESGVSATADRASLSRADVVQRIHDDLNQTSERDQPYQRYITLRNLHELKGGNGLPTEDDQMMLAYRAGVSKLVNSLSRAPQIIVPEPIDPEAVVLRIDLRHYGWTRSDWELLVAGYPFALEGVNGRQERAIARMSQSGRAWLRADWFAFAASQSPLYHDLLKLPRTEQALERQLGVDTLENLRDLEAIRAGFLVSGVSNANRLIERHVLPGYQGAYWKSYDFSPLRARLTDFLMNAPLGPFSAGLTQNRSLAFTHDGGEIIFHLPNGLQGYYLATADGKRLDRAPSEIVHDKSRSDGVILNGISCISCHSDGMNFPPNAPGLSTVKDDIGSVALERVESFRERRTVEALYTDAETLRREMGRDQRRFFKAVQEAYGPYADVHEPVALLYRHFNQPLDLNRVAAELGETSETILRVLKESDDHGVVILAAQLERGLPIPRHAWLQSWPRICAALDIPLRSFEPIPYEEFGGEVEGVVSAGIPSHRPVSGASARIQSQVALPGGGRLVATMSEGVVKVGDALDVRFKVTRDQFVRVVHFGADGSTTQMFPNEHQPNSHVDANQEIRILGPKTGVEWATSGKTGPEHIEFVATEVAFSDLKEAERFTQGEFVKSVAPDDVYTRGRLQVRPRTLAPSGRLARSVSLRLGFLLVE